MLACSPGARISWTVRTTTAIRPSWRAGRPCRPAARQVRRTDMRSFRFLLAALVATVPLTVDAQREHTRPNSNRSTALSDTQATELTLTLTAASVSPIQVWVRTAGLIDEARKVVAAEVPRSQAGSIHVGQRVRAFSPESRSRMYQATV